MGTILRADCQSCGLQAELYVGGGMRDYRPETAQAIALNDPDLIKALAQGARFRIERRVSSCPQCEKLVTAVRISYQLPGETAHIMAPRCPDCRSRLLWPSAERNEIQCPACGQNICLKMVGQWD